LTDVPLRGFLFSMFTRHTISMAQERNRFAPYRHWREASAGSLIPRCFPHAAMG
jgi:hypothetical protein